MKEKIVEVKIADIIIGERRRQIDEADIISLAESIMDVGLLNPIILREGNTLVAGLRRLTACKLLEWETVSCRVFPFDGPDAELAEIDENLERSELKALELAQHLHRRKELYEEKHRETKHGGDRRGEDFKLQKLPLETLPFAEDAAKKIKKSSRSVADYVMIGRDLDTGVQEDIKGTPIEDHKGDLMKLTKRPVGEQKKLGKQIKAGKLTRVPSKPAAPKPKKPSLPKPPKINQTSAEFNACFDLFVVQHTKYVKNFLKIMSEHPGGKIHPSPKKAVIGQLDILAALFSNLKNHN